MPENPGRTYAMGQAFKFQGRGAYAFQNFNVGGPVRINNKNHQFMPFGFSGITVTKNGDNVDASIVVPNSALAQAFALQAFEEQWVVKVTVGSFDVSQPKSFENVLYEYLGVVAAGGWNDTAIRMTLNSILDAVTGDVPHRVFDEKNVGQLPITANINLQ